MNNDLISRKYLLHELGKLSLAWEYGQGVTDCVRIVSLAPPVELKAELISQRSTGKTGLPFFERPKGEWIPFVYDYDIGGDHTRPPKEGEEPHWEEYWAQEFKCSICGCKNHMANYCPVCGADMREEGEP